MNHTTIILRDIFACSFIASLPLVVLFPRHSVMSTAFGIICIASLIAALFFQHVIDEPEV